MAISGGSTFAHLFPRWVERGGLGGISFFPVDERMVPIDDPLSNWGNAKEQLFDPLGRTADVQHFATSVQSYQALLTERIGSPAIFDTIFLGMGDDGHTASLFAGSSALKDTTSKVLQTESPKAPHPRITLGLATLWQARSLIAVASGKRKGLLLRRLLADDRSLPITLALAGHPSPILLLDNEAAFAAQL